MTRTNSRAKKSPQRVKRPKLPRTEPVRSWSTLFGAEPAQAGAKPAAAGEAKKSGDTVQRGVELGYRVIDEYMKQGAAVANAFGGPRKRQAPSGQDLPKMTQRMMQYASDFTSLWFDAMGVMMNNTDAQAASGTKPNPASAGARPDPHAGEQPVASNGRSRLALELRSTKPAEIIVALDEAISGPVKVEPLRARSVKKAITDVSVEPPAEAAAPLKLRVHVPDRMPAGRYTGAILDATSGQPRGRVTVTVGK